MCPEPSVMEESGTDPWWPPRGQHYGQVAAIILTEVTCRAPCVSPLPILSLLILSLSILSLDIILSFVLASSMVPVISTLWPTCPLSSPPMRSYDFPVVSP